VGCREPVAVPVGVVVGVLVGVVVTVGVFMLVLVAPHVNSSAGVTNVVITLMPISSATATSTVPAASAGIVTVMSCPEESVMTLVAAMPPKVTLMTLVPSRSVRMITTYDPPAGGPLAGETEDAPRRSTCSIIIPSQGWPRAGR
jgi:hypothetical protein